MSTKGTLDQPITKISGIGPALAGRLASLELHTIEDLLWHLPFRYDDFRTVTPISEVRIGQTVTVEATVELIANRRSPRRRMNLTEALVRDQTGTLSVIWFNQPFLAKNIKPGERLLLSGKVQSAYGTVQLVGPSYEKITSAVMRTGRLLPVYPSGVNLTQRQLRTIHYAALNYLPYPEDYLPESLLQKERLVSLQDALREIHFPQDEAQRDQALERLKFDELFLFQLRRQQEERGKEKRNAPAIPFSQQPIQQFVESLPFTLTVGQKKAAWEILQDMEMNEPMNRLLEGEVGSGKTVVAALAAYQAILERFQVLLMAPTEILARQHFSSIAKLFARYDISVFLWTHGFHEQAKNGTVAKLTKSILAASLQKDTPCLIIGTHALLEEEAAFSNVGLVIVDEQQRFGVGQRELIHTKGFRDGLFPHFLSLTATPIPRTLALALSGDLKLSVLSELPFGRKPITTRVVVPEKRLELYRTHVERELEQGRQAFVLAPLIEESDRLGVASATELSKELKQLLPKWKIGLLHGRLSSKDKDATLQAFVEHKTDVLVATAVVEVGIDIPNASLMVIEGAERFGLSQLHQLRGRVGRGEHVSFCYLLPTNFTPLVQKRLDAVAQTSNGFQLAELDLKLRGPGDLVGLMQSGFLDFRFASLGDQALMKRTSDLARELLDNDAILASLPALKAKLSSTGVQHRE